jgi:predicted porin
MQKKLLAVAVLASLPLVASAQSSVVVYGVMDAAIAHEDTGNTNGSVTRMISGNQSTSRLGFRGTEDLGNGLKGIFNLEAGVAIDTGAADSVLFGRRAVVGLQGSFGTVTLGREYTPIADVAKSTDVLGQGFYGTNLASFGGGKLTRRISNSVNYRSASMSGFKFGASYGLGEVATGPSQNLAGVSAEYTIGGLYLGAGYHTFERLATGDDKEYIIGAAYKMGAMEFTGNYMNADPEGANNEYEATSVGMSYALGANKFYVNYSRIQLETGAKGNSLALAYSYALSKRTNLYAAAGKMSNNNLGTFGLISTGSSVTPTGAGAAGKDPSAYSVGVRHSF